MEVKDTISLAGVIISFFALAISFGVLLQLRATSQRAKTEAELRIRPIAFVRDVELNLASDLDSILGLNLKVTNLGLGPALNVSVSLVEDVSLPATGNTIESTTFSKSSILQVLPNTNGNIQGTLTINVSQGNESQFNVQDTQAAASELSSNAATVIMPVTQRADGQTTLKLSALGIRKEELEKALNDALFKVELSSMSNISVTYENRPKRSESLVFVD